MHLIFYTSVSGAAYLNDLIGEWQSLGHRVSVCSSLSQTQYRGAKSTPQRVLLRLRMYLWFPLTAAWTMLRNQNAIHICTTNPFFIPFLASWFCWGKSSRTVHLLYDLYPEALILAGKLSKNGLISRCFRIVTRRSLRKCDVSVFLGSELQRYVEISYGKAKEARVIPVGADRNLAPNQISPITTEETLTILYCGNFGQMHDTATLVKALPILIAENESDSSNSSFHFRFNASGSSYDQLQANFSKADSPILTFGSPISDHAEWIQVMHRCRIGLITLSPGAEEIVMPSKTYSALMAGQAILAIAPQNSDLASLIQEFDCGWIITPGDADALVKLLRSLSTSPETVFRKQQNALAAGKAFFATDKVADQWETLFKELRNPEK